MSVAERVVEPDSAPRDIGHRRSRRSLQLGVFAVPMVWIAVLGWTHRWMTEDGFIYLRIVRHVREGNGPVFNEGERVEAFTGVLWVGALSLADLLTPIRLEWLSVLVGLGCTVAGVGFALAGARRLWAGLGDDAVAAPLGAVVFVALYPLWAYATSGLETGMVFAWLGACLWILGRWAQDPARSVTGVEAVVLGLGWLIRPEMVLFSAAFVLLVIGAQWSDDTWRRRAKFLAAAMALPVAYQVFRMGYFGSLVANTAIAKEGTDGNLERGWRYLSDFFEPYWLWVPLAGLLGGGFVPLAALVSRRRDWRRGLVAGTFVLCALLNAFYVVYVGGDYHHARMFLPALFAICAPVAAVPATRRHVAGLVVGAWAVFAVVTLRPEQLEADNWLANGFIAPREFGSVTRDEYGWGDGSPRLAWYDGPGYYYEAGIHRYPKGDVELRESVEVPLGAFYGVGISAYSIGTDFHVLDRLGLADTLTAHFEGVPSGSSERPRFPGHEKPMPPQWLAARLTPPGAAPDPAEFPSLFGNPLIPPTTGVEFQEEVAWARAALRCDEIAQLTESADEPLTLGRFASNFFRSFENTFMRIPPDPEEAYHRFCGNGTPPGVAALRGDR